MANLFFDLLAPCSIGILCCDREEDAPSLDKALFVRSSTSSTDELGELDLEIRNVCNLPGVADAVVEATTKWAARPIGRYASTLLEYL